MPLAHGRYIADHVDGARFVEIERAFHGSNRPEEMDRYIDEVETFVTGQRATARDVSGRVLATVLLTDIVASTQRAVSVGDARWTAIAEHDRVARHEIARFGDPRLGERAGVARGSS